MPAAIAQESAQHHCYRLGRSAVDIIDLHSVDSLASDINPDEEDDRVFETKVKISIYMLHHQLLTPLETYVHQVES